MRKADGTHPDYLNTQERDSDTLDLRKIFRNRLSHGDRAKHKHVDHVAYHGASTVGKVWHGFIWTIKLLVPDFLIGHPSLWDNLKILKSNPVFRPIRLLILAGLIFSLTLGSSGLYILTHYGAVSAANDFSIQTGSYYGTGISRAISGLGFRPEVVIIKADTAAGQLVWKSSSMAAGVSSYLGVATADNTETEITFDNDGFTVSAALEVNAINVTYSFIAFAGSDCTSGGAMCVGAFTGDTTSTQVITTGFQPDLVWVKRTTALAGTFRTSDMAVNEAGFFSATLNNSTGIYFETLDTTGFTVGSTNNTNGGLFYYVAFKNLAGKMKVGTFTGNGVDDRNITGLGFEPDFVLIKQNSAKVPAFNTTEMYGDYSSVTTAAASAVNHIQSLDADGFQVGNSTSVNANAIPSYYFAFGGAPDPVPSGSFTMERGSYTGTGVARSIATSFEPNLVIIKGNTAQYAVWSISLEGDATERFALAGAAFTNGITAMDENGFSVGTDATVNTNLVTYEYIVFGNATSPRTGAGAEDFYIGTYTGNGISGRAIDHLGFAPSMVVVKRSVGTSNLSFWRSSSMADNTSAYFSAVADITGSAIVNTLNSDGFTIGSNAGVNGSGGTYAWFAFKEGVGFDVGSYVGNGVVDTEITGLGFSPDFVWTKRSGASAGVLLSSSGTVGSGESLHFLNLANDTNDIKSLTGDGFTVGTSNEVNLSANTYNYAAWNSTTSGSPPSTPTNSAPSAGATAQNLNVTLTGSTYADADPNAQTNAQWQVDDDSDFATPVWTRTAGTAEVTTSVTSGNGTFANELSGKTELDHNTLYYWRVRYSDGVYSSWSTATSFTANTIATPSNSSPSSGATVTTLTPTLTASAFSDAQGAHTAASAQWQINTTNSFTSPLYESGTVSYSTTHAVPSATLSDRTSYYWRVRYLDSSSMWSEYSTATRFQVSKANVIVEPVFGSTVVDQGDSVKIDTQIKLADGTVINDATVAVSIYNPAGTKIVDGASMAYITGSNGVYRYAYTIPTTSGSYLYEVTAVSDNVSGYGAANFEVRTIAADLSSAKSIVQSEQTAQTSERTAQDTSRTTVTNIQTDVNTASSSIGSKISTSESNLSSNIQNASSSLAAKIDVSTTTVITEIQTASSSLGAKLNTIESKIDIIDANVDSILSTVNTVNTNLSAMQSVVNALRNSQGLGYRMTLSDVPNIQAGNTYRTRLSIVDFETNPVNASSTPSIVMYDPVRNVALATTTMTNTGTGIYEYSTTTGATATTGLWEAIVIANVGGSSLTANDYFQVTGAPAQVVINSMSDLTVDSIAADITITNEGNGPFEYQYEWCVVSSQANQCGGDDDVYYASAAKLINAGADFDTTLTATVPNVGSYYFKLVVYFGTENSGAARAFTAVTESSGGGGSNGGGGGGSSSAGNGIPGSVNFGGSYSSADIYNELLRTRQIVELNSVHLNQALTLLGRVDTSSPTFKSLLKVSEENTSDIRAIQNKISDLRAASAIIARVAEQNVAEPIIETYMKFNSVDIEFLITNPVDEKQTVEFKAFLPKEVRPEHVTDNGGLTIDFDPGADTYYVSAKITLGPGETISRTVSLKDIWVYPEDEVRGMQEQAFQLSEILTETQYGAQATILKGDIDETARTILRIQEESYSSPQEHIVAYRENSSRWKKMEDSLEKLKDLAVASGASRGLLGNIGGIQTYATWGIILSIVMGFALLIGTTMMLWRHQMQFAYQLMGNRAPTHVNRRRKKNSTIKTARLALANFITMHPRSEELPKPEHIPVTVGSDSLSHEDKIDKGLVLPPSHHEAKTIHRAETNHKVPKRRHPIAYRGPAMFFGGLLLVFIAVMLLVRTEGDSYNYQVVDESAVVPIQASPEESALPPDVAETTEDEGGIEVAPEVSQPTETTTAPTASSIPKVRVLETPTGYLNVRFEPSLSAEVIGKLAPGSTYEYTTTNGEWYLVTMKDGRRGWASGTYLTEASQ